MKVELPYTKDSFDADAQRRFLSAVASSVATPVGNLYIKSVVETTSSRRGLRKLLAASVEVEFAIRVRYAAAQAAMIANAGLAAPRLNAELAKQVARALCMLLNFVSVRTIKERSSSLAGCAARVRKKDHHAATGLTTPVLRATGAPRRPGAHAAGRPPAGRPRAARLRCRSSRGPGEGPAAFPRVFCSSELCYAKCFGPLQEDQYRLADTGLRGAALNWGSSYCITLRTRVPISAGVDC
jgi:hypothetical protein